MGAIIPLPNLIPIPDEDEDEEEDDDENVELNDEKEALLT